MDLVNGAGINAKELAAKMAATMQYNFDIELEILTLFDFS